MTPIGKLRLSLGLGGGRASSGGGVPATALLTEDGLPILTEDGQYILME